MTRRRQNPPRPVAPTTPPPPLGLRGVAIRSPPGAAAAAAATAFLLFGAFASAAGRRTPTTTTARLASSLAFFVGPKTTATKADRPLLLLGPRRRTLGFGSRPVPTRRASSPEEHVPLFPRRRGRGFRPVAASSSPSLDVAPPSPPSSSDDRPPSEEATGGSSGATTTTTPVVVVRRNRQSMSFREGSPLVFPGAISFTYERTTDDPDGGGAGGAVIVGGGGIRTGALVAVAVASKKEGGNRRSGGENRRGGGGGKKRKGKSGGESSSSSSSSYPHLIVSSVDGSIVSSSSSSEDLRSSFEEDWNDAQVIGYGVYNPKSMYRVRILCHASTHPETFRAVRDALLKKEKKKDDDGDEGRRGSSRDETKEDAESEALGIILRDKMSRAASVRASLGLPSASDTDTYRLINGEGDGLSGLAVDVLGGEVAVVASSASWCEGRKSVVVDALKRTLDEHPAYGGEGRTVDVVWRTTASRLAQDGHDNVVDRGGGEGREEDESSALSVAADDEDGNERGRRIVAIENGVKYVTYPFSSSTQKTGFYCDQRDNRLNFAKLCSGKRVLDLCCYQGGFALCTAILGNAERCVGVDSSLDAIETARENARLNDLDERTARFVREDVATYARRVFEEDEEERYDAIVLDPPKLAPSASSLERASRKYRALNRDAMKLIDPERGGLLLTCTCSAAMTQKDGGRYFLDVIRGAGYAAGRVVTLLSVNGPATCHVRSPASYPAGAYLTAALFHVGPAEQRR